MTDEEELEQAQMDLAISAYKIENLGGYDVLVEALEELLATIKKKYN